MRFQYSVQIKPFNLQTLLRDINAQYNDYLLGIGNADSMLACTLQENAAPEMFAEPHYLIDFPYLHVLRDHLQAFLCSKQIPAPIIYGYLVIRKSDLEASKLTNKDEGDYLFSLNKFFKEKQAEAGMTEPVMAPRI